MVEADSDTARAMQDLLLKDLSNKPELSDWFGRESVPKPPAILKPNPRNIEHDAKIAELEAKVKRFVPHRPYHHSKQAC